MLSKCSGTLEERKEIFRALVEAQDKKLNVRQSRKTVADEFGISEKVIKQIEDEGIDGQWPPL